MKNAVRFAVVFAGLMLGLSHPELGGASAAPQLSPNFLISSQGDAVSGKPAMAFDGVNFLCGFKVGNDIRAARVSPAGVVLDGSGIAVSTGLNDSAYPPSVGFDGTNYLLVWCAYRQGASEIYGARVTPAGEVLDPGGLKLTTGGLAEIRMPGLSFDGQNYLVVWRTLKAGGNNIYGALISPACVNLSPAAGFPIANLGCSYYPSASFDGTNYLVVWHDSRGADWNIYGARVTRSGVVLEPNGFLICGESQHQEHSMVIFDGTNHLVVWYDWRQGGTSPWGSAYGARITPGGVVLDSPAFKIADFARGEVAVQVAGDGTNNLIVWTREYAGTEATWRLDDVYARRLAKDGTFLERQPLSIATAFGIQFGPVVGYGGGKFLVAWYDLRDGSASIYGQIIPADLPAHDAPLRAAAPSSAAWNAQVCGTASSSNFNCGVAPASDCAYLFGPRLIMRWNGSGWAVAGDFQEGYPYGTWAGGAADVWVAGWAGGVNRFDGVQWTDLGCWPVDVIAGLWGSEARHLWAVGNKGRLLKHDGNLRWDVVGTDSRDDLHAIWGASANDIHAVGERGTVLHYAGTSWQRVTDIPTTQALNGIWGSDANDVFAVGDWGTILHFDGTSWTQMETCVTEHLCSVWGFSASDVYAVGLGGIILRYDGARWTPESSGTTLDLTTVFGAYNPTTQACTLWAAGTGNIVRTTTRDATVAITTSPASQVVTHGQPATLSVQTAGYGPVRYEWRKNGAVLPGATSRTLVIGSAEATDTGDYTCVVTSGAVTATSAVARLSVRTFTVAGRQLRYHDAPFQVRGVAYQPTPVGEDPRYAAPNGDYYTAAYAALTARDIPLLRQLGANVVRVYGWNPTADHQAFLDACYNGGVRPIFVLVNRWIDPNTDWANAAAVDALRREWLALDAGLKNHPAVLGILLGNEVNAQNGNGGKAAYWTAMNGIAAALKEQNPSRLVSIAITDALPQVAANDATMTALDFWSVQVYRGASFGSLFADYAAASTRPLVVTEFGMDAYNQQAGAGYPDAAAQTAAVVGGLWREIEASPSLCAGGCVFAFCDEWWKGAGGSASTHDAGGWATGAFPDGFANEEWWGLYAIGGTGAPNVLVPRAAVTVLRVLWNSTRHTADTDLDGRISLVELTRVIELYNTRCGAVRTGAYGIAPATEDGFGGAPWREPGVTATLLVSHGADTNHDGAIGLIELTRVIQLYNYRNGNSRTGEYHACSGTEDGFELGP